jgi:hypothetical protein
LKEKGNSHESYKQHAASGMPEKYSWRFGNRPTGTVIESWCAMPENKVENQVELPADSMQENPCKMTTPVV